MNTKKALVYISETSEEFSEDSISKLVDLAAANNLEHGISGYLFYSNRKFLQYIEGEAPVLNQLYENIAKDPRHTIINKVENEELKYFKFISWNMRYLRPEELKEISIEKLIMETLENRFLERSDFHDSGLVKRIWKMTDVLSNNQWRLTS